MTTDEVLSEFRAAGALLEGHFILSSGLHSPLYLQKNLVFRDPRRTERLCRALAAKAKARVGEIDIVISPAVGGIIPGYETARALGAEAIFVEREEKEFKLRRDFTIAEGARVLMVEDIVSTGLSSRECLAAIARRTRQYRRRRVPYRPLGRAGRYRRADGRAGQHRRAGLSGRRPAARACRHAGRGARQPEA